MLIRPLTKRFVRTEGPLGLRVGPLGLRAGSPLRADHILHQKHLWPVLSPRALWVALIPTPTQEPSYSALPPPTSPAGSFPGRQRRVSDNSQLPSSQGRTMNAGLLGFLALGPQTRETPRHCQHCYQTPSRVSPVEWGSLPSCPPPTLSPLSQKDPASPGSTSGAAPGPGPRAAESQHAASAC